MAPPSAPEGYWKRPKVADPALCTNVPGLADNLNGVQSAAKIDLTIGRSDAAYYLWKVAVSSEKGRNEVAKAGCTQRLLDLMVSGSFDAKFHAVGCLQSLIALDETRDAVASSARYIACLGDLLLGKTHDRIQPVAADILHTICLNPELSPRVAPVIPQLVELCRRREPVWAGVEKACYHAACCLQILAGSAAGLRKHMVREGAVPALLNMLHRTSWESKCAAIGGLAMVGTEPGVAGRMAEEPGLVPEIVKLLSTPYDEARISAAKCLSLLATSQDVCHAIMAEGGLPPLVALLKPVVSDSGQQKKKKKSKKGQQLPPILQQGIVHGSACLMHLSFIDENRKLLAESGGLPTVVELLNDKNVEIFQNCSRICVNLAMDAEIRPLLKDLHAPEHILLVHERLLISPKKQAPAGPKAEEEAGKAAEAAEAGEGAGPPASPRADPSVEDRPRGK